LPRPSDSSQATIWSNAWRLSIPSKRPLFTIGPSPTQGRSPSQSITRRTSSPNLWANSKSRSSWPGTAMIAPVPYSIST
jgi:hypothetical protein